MGFFGVFFVVVVVTSHVFYSFNWDTISYFMTFPHCVSAGNVNTFQDSSAAFSGEKSQTSAF